LESIIIFRIGSLGDTVVALPCFHLIARSFPNSQRIVVTNIPASQKAAPLETVLENSGLIDDVIYFPPSPRKLRDFLTLRTRIRNTEAKMLIYIADRSGQVVRTLRDLCFFRACGIRSIIGVPLTRELRRPRIDTETGHTEREAERLARCLAPLGSIDLHNREGWDLRLQPDEMRTAERMLAPLAGRRFIAINIGGKIQTKDWGDDNWTALFRLMTPTHSDLALAFFGSEDESDRSAGLAAVWSGSTLNLCGRLKPRESAAAMQRALFFLGHDSGPMHLADAAGIPCVGLFGNNNMPKWWHPMGQGHHIIHNMRGVREISPDEVYAAVRLICRER
jgi:ADP-heptose:LPS heptosyltransferase